MPCHQDATAIYALPAEPIARGFRLLVMREFRSNEAPPAFAVIEQLILRAPERRNRHGISFAAAFRPEIMDWLIAELGRPSQREEGGEARRNPRWPGLTWRYETRNWPDGIETIEWYADVVFPEETSWAAFHRHWQVCLQGGGDSEA